MTKLTKRQSKLHDQAAELLKKDNITEDDAEFIFTNWHEGSCIDQTAAGAFFTPHGLAHDLTIDIGGQRVIEFCAGIGVLAYHLYHYGYGRYGDPKPEITCIERVHEFAEIGKKLLPQAHWICADVFDYNYSALQEMVIRHYLVLDKPVL